MMPRLHRLIVPVVLCAVLALAAAAEASPDRTASLRRALSAEGAVRNVYFVRGMNCRACTIIIDRVLNGMEGVYWARFSYPVRLLTVYSDPAKVSGSAVEKPITSSDKLELELLESGAAGDYAPREGDPVASWRGGSISLAEARELPGRFREMLDAYSLQPGAKEWDQVVYEIVSETVRGRILLVTAAENGYSPGKGGGDLPVFISKDFYWPVELLPLTPEEAAVGSFVREKVIAGDESEKGLERFDGWLLGVWKDFNFDYRGEIIELSE
jgi:hypothetical protein